MEMDDFFGMEAHRQSLEKSSSEYNSGVSSRKKAACVTDNQLKM
jgi:hypothetical protein